MNRRLLRVVLAVGTILASFAIAIPASAQVIVVLPGESIHAAVKSAKPGDTIQLSAGVGNGFAGLYIGDSRRASATVEGNESFDKTFGLFLRDAAHGNITGNQFHDDCIGVLILETPGPVRAGRFTIADNTIEHNNAFCRGEGRGEPSTAGTGIAIFGGRGNTIQGNVIARNRTSRNVPFHGGVVLVESAADNTVTGNTLLRNRPNIFTDGSGSGNRISDNTCTPGC